MTIGKTVEAAEAKELIVGAQKHFASAASLAFASGTHTATEIETALQAVVDLRADVEAARAALEAKIAAEKSQMATLRPLVRGFVAFVKLTFSNSPDVLADFGLRPNKTRTPLTIEQKAVASARGKSTRAARHTMGTQQKKALKGNVTGVVLTPITAGSAPAPAAPVTPAPKGNALPLT